MSERGHFPDLQGKMPGDLISSEEITDRDDPNFPPNARAWRVEYVSTGRDNTDLTLIQGVVVAPDSASRIATRETDGMLTGQVVAWAHGTLGLVARCMPSEDPSNLIWGAAPWGINALALGSEADGTLRIGRPEDGILAGMIAKGWIVTATDYYVDRWGGDGLQPYLLGKVQAAHTIDSVRAAHHLLRRVYTDHRLQSYDVVTWGHSQGGHAALWAGQLLQSYAAATAAPDGPTLALSGVAIEAPASTFVTRPDLQPDTALGFGLFDWLANATLKLTGIPEPLPLAPFLFSYLIGAWSRYAAGGPADPAAMPAYPNTGPLDVSALVRPDALPTLERMTQLCWSDGEQIAESLMAYRTKGFLQPELSEGQVFDGLRHGAFDEMAAGDPAPELAAWREWILYNLPGPLGTSDLDKLPRRGEQLAPIMIAHGANDGVVHCVVPEPSLGTMPSAQDCMSVALYEVLKDAYCRDGEPTGYLALSIWQPEPGVTLADHSDIRGLNAAAESDVLCFEGSPLQRFITAAFEGTLAPECTATLVNAPS